MNNTKVNGKPGPPRYEDPSKLYCEIYHDDEIKQCRNRVNTYEYRVRGGVGIVTVVACPLHVSLLQQKHPDWKFIAIK